MSDSITVRDPNGFTRYWWMTIPQVPPSRHAVDHWAPRDGRTSRYGRLGRIFLDHTAVKGAARIHDMAAPAKGIPLLIRVFENFGLFSPGEWLPEFVRMIGIKLPFVPVDVLWSYEYEATTAPRGFKIIDLALHLRGRTAGDDFALMGEVKRPGDKLKLNVARPDNKPESYLDVDGLASAFPPDRRSLFYLVDATYLPEVRRLLSAASRWGATTWDALVNLQCELAERHYPQIAKLLRFLFCECASGCDITGVPTAELSAGDAIAAATSHINKGTLPQHVVDYLRSAVQWLHCRSAKILPSPCFTYLTSEPSFEEISRGRSQSTAARRLELWRLPPRNE